MRVENLECLAIACDEGGRGDLALGEGGRRRKRVVVKDPVDKDVGAREKRS